MQEFKELEYKYDASDVKLKNFEDFMATWEGTLEKIEVSSWDVYYTKEDNPEWFQRYRAGHRIPELTKKRKVKNSNNWERVEIDLPLDPKRINENIVENFVRLDGYHKNFKIHKTCFIYKFDFFSTVWYNVCDENMNEKRRFIEIEVNKDKVEELGGEEKAFEFLRDIEKRLEPLDISAQQRMKKSLFEIFYKNNINKSEE